MTGALWQERACRGIICHSSSARRIRHMGERAQRLLSVFSFLSTLDAYSAMYAVTRSCAICRRLVFSPGADVKTDAGHRSVHPSPSRLLAAPPL